VSVSSAKAYFHQDVSAHRLRKKRWEGTAEATQFFTHQSKVGQWNAMDAWYDGMPKLYMFQKKKKGKSWQRALAINLNNHTTSNKV
jgi:hypothetical protein